MTFNTIQNNFASGELSPNLWGRVDRPFYKSGLEVCRNFTPLLTGGCFFRPGFEYSIHSRLNNPARGLPYRFNIDQAYTLEFTDYKLRIHRNGGVILETAITVTGVSQANPGIVTATSHGFSDGDEVYFTGIVGMEALNSQFFLVNNATTHTFTLTDVDGAPIDTTDADAYVSGGTVARVYEIDSPYLAEDIRRVKYCGTADLMYMYHPDYEPRVLIRAGNTSWTLETYNRYSSTKVITAISKANPGMITSTDHGFVGGERIYLSHIKGMTELNETEFLLQYDGTATFSLKTLAGVAVDTSAYTIYESGGDIALVRKAPQTITAITQADPGVITLAAHGLETADKIYVYDIAGMTELNTRYFWVTKIDANTFSLTDEAGASIDTSGYTAYTSGGKITYISGLFTKIGDFPGACGLYGGRFVAGGSDNDPDVFWLSKGPDAETGAAQYNDFTIGTEDTAGMVYTLTSQNFTADRIRWFSGTPNFMILGTTGGVYKANGGVDGSAITPTAISVTPISSVGVADLMPLFINNQTYYLEQGSLTLRAFGYSLLEDTYKSFDKNILAEDITSGGIIQLAYAKGRPELVYAVREDGVLLSCTILEQDDVAGWARQIVGGGGKVLSIVTESQATGFDRVGVFVERTIDGQTRRYIEYRVEDPIVPRESDYFTTGTAQVADLVKHRKLLFEAQKQFVRLDSALVLDNTQTVAITLSALTGDTVTVTAASSLFTSDDTGKYIYVKFVTGEETGIGETYQFNSATEIVMRVKEVFSALTFATGAWYFAGGVVRGLGHLEGETVSILADGGVHADKDVADGEIILDYPVRYAIIGLKYTGIIRTLDLELTTASGPAQSRLRNVERLFFKLRNTLGGKYGATLRGLYTLTEMSYRKAGQSSYDRPPALFSGLKQVPIRDTWANEKKIYVVQDQPLPMQILAILPAEDIGEAE